MPFKLHVSKPKATIARNPNSIRWQKWRKRLWEKPGSLWVSVFLWPNDQTQCDLWFQSASDLWIYIIKISIQLLLKIRIRPVGIRWERVLLFSEFLMYNIRSLPKFFPPLNILFTSEIHQITEVNGSSQTHCLLLCWSLTLWWCIKKVMWCLLISTMFYLKLLGMTLKLQAQFSGWSFVRGGWVCWTHGGSSTKPEKNTEKRLNCFDTLLFIKAMCYWHEMSL